MAVFITVLIIIIVFAFIAWPFFQRATVNRPEKPVKRITRDIDDEIERKVREIRSRKQLACPNCGAKYAEGSRFCAQCGKELPDR